MALSGPKALPNNMVRAAVALSNRVFRSDQSSPMGDEFPLLLHKDNADHLRVFTDGRKVVSLVGMFVRDAYLLDTRHLTCCIGAVCTDAAYRAKGLATELMEDARRKALADGVDIFLISGGRGLYRRLGYVDVGTYYVASVRRSKLPTRGSYCIRPWEPEDLPALVRIRSAEPVRFARTVEDFAGFLKTGKIACVPGETAVVCAEGSDQPVAYVSYQLGGAAWESKDKNAVTVAEMAGPRCAIMRALGSALEERGLDSAEVHYLGSDAEFAELARSFGWPSRPRGFRGTVGVIDPARFWEACAPLFAERIGPARAAQLSLTAGDRLKIDYKGEQVTLDGMTAFTNLAFLPPHRRTELELGLPVRSPLRRLLDEVFPLPLVDYGLNYV